MITAECKPQLPSEPPDEARACHHNFWWVPFDEVPRHMHRCVYGVPYVQLDDATGGQLLVTRHGWRLWEHVDPANWYFRRQYSRRGRRLSEGSGAVYGVPSAVRSDRSIKLIVKFSRMAQDVPLNVSVRFPVDVPQHVLDEAAFNDPFQEFGALEALRNSRFGPGNLKIRTKRPLAIYSPGRRFDPWQLGRKEDRFRRHARQLARDQATREPGTPPFEISIERQYIYLFHWIAGENAESLLKAGVLSDDETAQLVGQVVDDLAAKGFRVLDTKPNHVILRRRPNGELLTRDGRLSYALVDFELLQPTEEYRRWRENSANAGASTATSTQARRASECV